MKLTATISAKATADTATATAPNWNSDIDQSDYKKLQSENKNSSKRIKFRPVDVDIPKTEREDNWDSLRMVCGLQGLAVFFMIKVQLLEMDYIFGEKIDNYSHFVCYFWICVLFMSIAFLFTWHVAYPGSRSTYCITLAMSSQYCALFVWFVFLVLRVTIASSVGKEYSNYERLVMGLSLITNFGAALVTWFSAKLLWTVGGFEARKKVRSFNNRYGDIVFEVIEVEAASGQGPPKAETPIDDSGEYDLV